MKLDDKIKEKSDFNLNYNKISNEIDFDKYTKKASFMDKLISFIKLRKMAVSFASLVLIIGILSIAIFSNLPDGIKSSSNTSTTTPQPTVPSTIPSTKPEPTIPKPTNPNNTSATSGVQNGNTDKILLDESSIIGIAAFKEFDNAGTTKLRNLTINTTTILNTNESEYLKVSYPYDYVKIKSAYKFSIEVEAIDNASESIIKESCGLGQIEVVVVEFETFISDNGMLVSSVEDTLISLRGHNGYYTILENSGSYGSNYSLVEFSSHKKILEGEINKDFEPPILTIFLETIKNERYVYFDVSDDVGGKESYNRDLAYKSITKSEIVSNNTMYSVLDLIALPKVKVEAEVIEVYPEYNMIYVKNDSKLAIINLNEYTQGEDINNIKIGDTILVEYDDLFDEYDPESVIANNIEII